MQNPHAALTSRTKTFEIGKNKYVLTTHGYREGRYYALRVAAMLPGPLSDAVDHVKEEVGLERLFNFFIEEGGGATLAGVFNKYDLNGVGDHLSKILNDLSDDDRFLDGLFQYVARNGTPLSNESALSDAFSGNWAEYDLALLHIIQANGWLPFQFTSES